MSPFRYRDEESSSTGTILGVLAGAVAGFAVGMLVAQRVGGISGLKSKLTRRGAAAGTQDTLRDKYGADQHLDEDEFEDVEGDDFEEDDLDEGLEERVLEAFRND